MDHGFLDDERVEMLDEREREWYEYVITYGSEEEIEEAREYFG